MSAKLQLIFDIKKSFLVFRTLFRYHFHIRMVLLVKNNLFYFVSTTNQILNETNRKACNHCQPYSFTCYNKNTLLMKELHHLAHCIFDKGGNCFCPIILPKKRPLKIFKIEKFNRQKVDKNTLI